MIVGKSGESTRRNANVDGLAALVRQYGKEGIGGQVLHFALHKFEGRGSSSGSLLPGSIKLRTQYNYRE